VSVEVVNVHPAALTGLPCAVSLSGKRIGGGWAKSVDLQPAHNLVIVEITGGRGPVELELRPEVFAGARVEPPLITVEDPGGIRIVAFLPPLTEDER
jgi:hypothetical protein